MQISTSDKESQVVGYGHIGFKESSIKNGVVVDPEAIAKQVYTLTTEHMIGQIDTKRVVASLPAANTFNRVLVLPEMDKKDEEG